MRDVGFAGSCTPLVLSVKRTSDFSLRVMMRDDAPKSVERATGILAAGPSCVSPVLSCRELWGESDRAGFDECLPSDEQLRLIEPHTEVGGDHVRST